MDLELVDVEAEIPDEIMNLEEPMEEAIEVIEAPIAPKRKGRPPGSKSKEPGKPRAPRKKMVSIEEEPVPTDTIRIEDDDLPRVLENSQPIPRYSRDDASAMLLQLLSNQASRRKQNRVELWESWFK